MMYNESEIHAKSISHIVAEKDLATHWNNDIPVLSTPVLLWLGEIAAMEALDECLSAEFMSVGVSHDMRHLAPTPLGFRLIITAEPIDIAGRIITFSVSGHDGTDIVLSGTHQRAIIDRKAFLEKISLKSENTC